MEGSSDEGWVRKNEATNYREQTDEGKSNISIKGTRWEVVRMQRAGTEVWEGKAKDWEMERVVSVREVRRGGMESHFGIT